MATLDIMWPDFVYRGTINMPIPTKRQEICPKCGWKSKYINTSDCICFFHGECPKCHAKTELRTLKTIFDTVKNIFK